MGGIARATASKSDVHTTPPATSVFLAAKVDSIGKTAFDSPAALKAGDAGSHGVEKQMAAPWIFSGFARDMAKPSAAMITKAKATLAHLRTMDRWYTRLRSHAIRSADEKTRFAVAGLALVFAYQTRPPEHERNEEN